MDENLRRLRKRNQELRVRIADLKQQNAELVAALEGARDAIATLDINAFGTAHVSGTGEPYPIRDEIIYNITKALAKVKEE